MIRPLERGHPEARQAALDRAPARRPRAGAQSRSASSKPPRAPRRPSGALKRSRRWNSTPARRTTPPRPGRRARSWWSWASPKRSAPDDHHRGLGDIDAHLDHRRPDEDLDLAIPEARHLGVAVGGLHPAVDHPDRERRQQPPKPDGPGLSGRRGCIPGILRGPVGCRARVVGLRLVDQGDDDERPGGRPQPPREPSARCRRARPGGEFPRTWMGTRPSGGVRGSRRRGRRTAPGRACDRRGGHEQDAAPDRRRPSPRAGSAAPRRTGAARR